MAEMPIPIVAPGPAVPEEVGDFHQDPYTGPMPDFHQDPMQQQRWEQKATSDDPATASDPPSAGIWQRAWDWFTAPGAAVGKMLPPAVAPQFGPAATPEKVRDATQKTESLPGNLANPLPAPIVLPTLDLGGLADSLHQDVLLLGLVLVAILVFVVVLRS